MMRRLPLSSVPLSVALAISAALWWTAPAGAQTPTVSTSTSLSTTSLSASTTVSTSTSSATTTTSTAALVPVRGVVTGGPESVVFSGQAKLSAKVVTDPDFGGTPTVVLSFDLSGLSGVGASTGAKYVTSDGEIVQRGLTAVDMVEYTFPFYRSGTSPMEPSLGLASFNLVFNVNTLKLTAAAGHIGSP
jgi:hypothetical protein